MIHPTAIVSHDARIGNKVNIGPYCIVHPNVEIGDGSNIGAYSEIGIPTPLAKTNSLRIGKNSVIRSNAVIYIGSTIGDNLTTGHYVSIRENSDIGSGVQIGNRGDIQGDCSIGDYTKMHSDVHIGKLSKIGSYCWLFPEVLLTNDPTPPSDDLLGPTIKDFAVVASKCILMPGVVIEKNSVIAAGSLVNTNIPEGVLAQGNPARAVCKANILRMKHNIKIKAYPWHKRFFRGYPDEIVLSWKNE